MGKARRRGEEKGKEKKKKRREKTRREDALTIVLKNPKAASLGPVAPHELCRPGAAPQEEGPLVDEGLVGGHVAHDEADGAGSRSEHLL